MSTRLQKENPLTEGITVTYAQSKRGAHANLRDVHVENVSLSFHRHRLLEDTDIQLSYGQRYGLIGPNGCGKTTLMNAIGHRMFYIPDTIDVFHLHR